MAEYTPVPSRAWSSVVFAVNGDGTGTFWANTMLPWWNRFHTVAYYLVDGGTIPASGASLNSQGAAPGDPDGLGLLGFSGKSGAASPFNVASTLRVLVNGLIDGLAAANTEIDTKEDAVHLAVTAPDADTSFSITPTTNRVIYVPLSLGADRAYTLNDPATNGITVTFSRIVAGGVNQGLVKNSGGSTLVTIGTSGMEWALLRSIGGAWVLEARTPDL